MHTNNHPAIVARKAVCERRVIRKDVLEGAVVVQIEAMLQRYFGTPEGLKEIRRLVEAEMAVEKPQIGNELDQVDARLPDIKQTITNLIDNLTAANREYVDARIIELKRETVVTEARRLDLLAAGAKRLELDRLVVRPFSWRGNSIGRSTRARWKKAAPGQGVCGGDWGRSGRWDGDGACDGCAGRRGGSCGGG